MGWGKMLNGRTLGEWKAWCTCENDCSQSRTASATSVNNEEAGPTQSYDLLKVNCSILVCTVQKVSELPVHPSRVCAYVSRPANSNPKTYALTG
jgi:hypothetical protein